MKSTKAFKKTIQDHLENRAAKDSLFKKTYAKKDKNIDDCITFILNTVKEADIQGWNADEIFSMAVHYYDEDGIDIGKDVSNVQVVVNHQVQLTDEELKEAKDNAMKKAEEEQLKNIKKRKSSTHPSQDKQTSLF